MARINRKQRDEAQATLERRTALLREHETIETEGMADLWETQVRAELAKDAPAAQPGKAELPRVGAMVSIGAWTYKVDEVGCDSRPYFTVARPADAVGELMGMRATRYYADGEGDIWRRVAQPAPAAPEATLGACNHEEEAKHGR